MLGGFFEHLWRLTRAVVRCHNSFEHLCKPSNFEKVLWKNSIGLKSEQPIYQSSGHLLFTTTRFCDELSAQLAQLAIYGNLDLYKPLIFFPNSGINPNKKLFSTRFGMNPASSYFGLGRDVPKILLGPDRLSSSRFWDILFPRTTKG